MKDPQHTMVRHSGVFRTMETPKVELRFVKKISGSTYSNAFKTRCSFIGVSFQMFLKICSPKYLVS